MIAMGTDIIEAPRLATQSSMGNRTAGAPTMHGVVESASTDLVAALSSSPSWSWSSALTWSLPASGATLRHPRAQDAAGGTPSAGSASFRRSAISSRLTRLRLGTSASGNHRASSLEPPTSLRSSPLMTVARYTMRIA